MKLHLRTRNVRMSDQLRAFIEKRLQETLGRFDRRIDLTRVNVENVNGPRGGDKCCSIQTNLTHGGPVVIEAHGSSVIASVNQAIDRVVRRVREELNRRRTLRRRPRLH